MNTDTLAAPPELPVSIKHGRGETILLAEDQLLMQVVTRRLLERIGYRVLTASSVEEALVVWLDHESEIHLLITDFTFNSTLTGMDLIMKVHKRMPTLPALIVSGSWVPDQWKKPSLPSGVAFLAKPYQITDLAAAIRRMLETPRPMVGLGSMPKLSSR